MDDDENYRMVTFDKFCPTCEYSGTDGNDMPCDACLSEPVNLYSEKPVKYKEKETK